MKKTKLIGLLLASSLLITPAANAQSKWPIFTGKAQSSQALSVDPSRGVLTIAPLIERVAPAVVNISVRSTRKRPKIKFRGRGMDDELFEKFFGENSPFKEFENDEGELVRSAGSGVIINAGKGYILTNNHVIDGADKITVILKDRRRAKAKVIGTDPKTDIALLQIDLSGLSDVRIADSGNVKVGDYVIAIGNSFGIGQTVTTGIVSALGRTTNSGDKYQNYIQTDAAINQGNSGGALINSKGELIGINSAILSRSGGSNGIGFAVPTNMITKIMDQLIAYGEVKRGRIGVGIQNITPDLQQAMGLPSADGALIRQVEIGSPAEKAGLKVGDVIVGFNGEEILDADDIRNAVGLVERGSRAKLTYLRDGKRFTTRIKIVAAEDDGITNSPTIANDDTSSSFDVFDGVIFGNIPSELNPEGGKKGVMVTKVKRGSDAWEAGLQKGDIVRSVNNTNISNMADFKREVSKRKGAIFLNVQRGRNHIFVALKKKK